MFNRLQSTPPETSVTKALVTAHPFSSRSDATDQHRPIATQTQYHRDPSTAQCRRDGARTTFLLNSPATSPPVPAFVCTVCKTERVGAQLSQELVVVAALCRQTFLALEVVPEKDDSNFDLPKARYTIIFHMHKEQWMDGQGML